MDFTAYKFRPSSIGQLMVDPRSKSESLSETTKSYLSGVFLDEVYGRRKEITSKFLEKGVEVEEDSLTLVTQTKNKLYIKNKNLIENDFVKGTPDIIDGDTIVDIKSSWDLFTFHKADVKDMYYYQLQAYMWLTGKKQARLIYCLVNSPAHMIYQELRREAFKQGLADMEGTPEFAEMEAQVEKNMTFDDIPAKDRVKVFAFDYDSDTIHKMIARVESSREYLGGLSL